MNILQSAEVRRYTTGTRVRFHGLQTQTALNGCVGHVLQFDRASGRVCVEKDVASKGESPSIRIKPKNLETIEPMSRDLNEVKRLVEEAYRRGDGARVALPKGDYLIPPDPTTSALDQSLNAICNTLWIKQGMVLAGRGAGETTLHFGIEMVPGADGALLQLEGFSVVGASVEIGGRGLQKVRLSRVRIDMRQKEGDALMIKEVGSSATSSLDRVVIDQCEVLGGSDGVEIDTAGVTLRKCTIKGAASRGIFANDFFIIEDSTVMGCGSYGMKTRAGCDRRGRNRIQPGPWDGHMALGEDAMARPFAMAATLGEIDAMALAEEEDWEEDSDGQDEIGPYGFTHDEEMELLSQGVHPWDDDAGDVLAALQDDGF